MPLYQQVKAHIRDKIAAGEFRANAKIPSENDLVKAFGVSRMTANRALRELTDEGLVTRVPGLGSFVARTQARGQLHIVRNIADEVRERGGSYSSVVLAHKKTTASADLIRWMELGRKRTVFHSRLIHCENELPIQVEHRYVSPVSAPAYGNIDLGEVTPAEFLLAELPLQKVEHTVKAAMPDKDLCKQLDMRSSEPVLILERRTWSRDMPVSYVEFYHAASKYCMSESFSPSRR